MGRVGLHRSHFASYWMLQQHKLRTEPQLKRAFKTVMVISSQVNDNHLRFRFFFSGAIPMHDWLLNFQDFLHPRLLHSFTAPPSMLTGVFAYL